MCVCVCVCVRERERERERGYKTKVNKGSSRVPQTAIFCPFVFESLSA
jgi:hypothetical protein